MKRIIWEILILLALCAAGAGLTKWLHPKAPAWRLQEDPEVMLWQITPEEIRQYKAAGEDLVWIDARTREEFEAGHHQGARLLNPEEWENLMWEYRDWLTDLPGKTVIVYCDGSRCLRSREIAQRLRENLGLEKVYFLKGDWREYRAGG